MHHLTTPTYPNRANLTNESNGMLKESSLVHRRKEVKTKRSSLPSIRHIAWGLAKHTVGWWMSVCIPSRQENQTRAQRGVNVSLEYGRMDMLVRLCIFVMPFHAENIIICSFIFFIFIRCNVSLGTKNNTLLNKFFFFLWKCAYCKSDEFLHLKTRRYYFIIGIFKHMLF